MSSMSMRILVKREVSGVIADRPSATTSASWMLDQARRIFTLNMGIYRLKYSMNLLMNLMHHLSVASAFWPVPSRGKVRPRPARQSHQRR